MKIEILCFKYDRKIVVPVASLHLKKVKHKNYKHFTEITLIEIVLWSVDFSIELCVHCTKISTTLNG